MYYKINDYQGLFKWNDRVCYKISCELPKLQQKLKYRAQEGETLYSISRKNYKCWKIKREYNIKYDDDDILEKDQIIVLIVYMLKRLSFLSIMKIISQYIK